MNIPDNHHYVSQCQIKNFFNEITKEIYLYDKQLDNFYSKTTTKSVFSESGLNTTLDDDGQMDFNSVEKNLKDGFEDSFRKNTDVVLNALTLKYASLEFKKSLDEIARLAIIGEFRTPSFKRRSDNALEEAFKMIRDNADEKLKANLDKFFEDRNKTKYSNTLNYSEIAEKIFEKMGTVNHQIVWIQSDDFFVLPDCSSINRREKINEYFNPDLKEIASVGIPLTSKVFILTSSNKLKTESDGLMIIKDNNHDYVFQINGTLLVSSHKAIACESEEFLNSFIDRFKKKVGLK